jgi:hypothetical protein
MLQTSPPPLLAIWRLRKWVTTATAVATVAHATHKCHTPAFCLQIWRVRECDELYQQLRPSFSQLPASFQSSVHYHLGIHAGHPPMKLLRALRDAAHTRGGEEHSAEVERQQAADTT